MMKRQALSGGGWFDLDKAESLGHHSNGEWHMQSLYHTAAGLYVLNYQSRVDGESDSYVPISPAESAAWLISYGDELPDDLVEVAAADER